MKNTSILRYSIPPPTAPLDLPSVAALLCFSHQCPPPFFLPTIFFTDTTFDRSLFSPGELLNSFSPAPKEEPTPLSCFSVFLQLPPRSLIKEVSASTQGGFCRPPLLVYCKEAPFLSDALDFEQTTFSLVGQVSVGAPFFVFRCAFLPTRLISEGGSPEKSD